MTITCACIAIASKREQSTRKQGHYPSAALSLEELLAAVEKVLAAGHPRLPDPTKEEMQKYTDPVLAIMRARSWKEFERTGASYVIAWTDQEIRMDVSCLNKQGVWEYDLDKVRNFPPDTPLPDIMGVILEDIRSRPELMAQCT